MSLGTVKATKALSPAGRIPSHRQHTASSTKLNATRLEMSQKTLRRRGILRVTEERHKGFQSMGTKRLTVVPPPGRGGFRRNEEGILGDSSTRHFPCACGVKHPTPGSQLRGTILRQAVGVSGEHIILMGRRWGRGERFRSQMEVR